MIIVITGATKGIGRATARGMAKKGTALFPINYKNIFGIIFFFSSLFFLSCDPAKKPIPLSESIWRVIDTLDGDFAIAYFNINSRDSILIHENEQFHAASTMKTPVMIEAFKQMQKRGLKLSDSLEIYNNFYSIVDSSTYSLSPENDGDTLLYHYIGQKVTWENLIDLMITRSSNLATNILIDHLGAQNVTFTMRDLGAPDIQVLRGVEDIKAYNAGLSNTTTAYDLMRIYVKLADYEVIDSASSQAMIDVLLNQEFNSLIPAPLPADVKVAHKTGEITGVHHDSGIVMLPNGQRYVLVILSKNVQNMNDADKGMIEISRLVYESILHAQKAQ